MQLQKHILKNKMDIVLGELRKESFVFSSFSYTSVFLLIYLTITEGLLRLISKRQWRGKLKPISFEPYSYCISASLSLCLYSTVSHSNTRTHRLYNMSCTLESMQDQHVINTPTTIHVQGQQCVCTCAPEHTCMSSSRTERWSEVKDNKD